MKFATCEHIGFGKHTVSVRDFLNQDQPKILQNEVSAEENRHMGKKSSGQESSFDKYKKDYPWI